MAGTDNTQLIFGRQVSPDDGGDLRTAAASWRVTGSASAGQSGANTTLTGLTGSGITAGTLVHVTGFADSSKINGFYEVATTWAGSGGLVLKTPAGKKGLTAALTSGVEVGSLTPLRRASGTFGAVLNKTASDEIVPDRGTADLTRQGQGAQGSAQMGLVLQNVGHIIQAAFCNDWTYRGDDNRGGTGSNVTFTAPGTIGESGIEGDWAVGDSIYISDPGGLNDGKLVLVSALGTDEITVIGDELETQATRDPELILADDITPGFKLYPYTVERRYNDITGGEQHFPRFLGMSPGSVSLSGSANAPMRFSVSFTGAQEVSPTPTSSLGVATARPTGSELSTVSDAQAWIDGSNGGCLRDLTLSINNNLSPQTCWGSDGATAINVRALDISGSFTRYYRTRALYDKFLSDSQIELLLSLKSPEGARYMLWMPRVELANADRSGGGRNSDLFFTTSFTALIDESLGFTAKLFRIES